MTRILALLTDAFGAHGGIAQYNRDFLSALADGGSRVTVLVRHAPDRAEPPSGIRQLPALPGRAAFIAKAMQEALRTRYDVVFCGHLYTAPLAAVVARIAKAKLVLQTHGVEAWPRPTRFQRTAADSADLILSVSRYTRAAVLRWSKIAPDRVAVVPNTVRACFVPSAPEPRQKRVLLTAARMSSEDPYKGHELVIASLPAVLEAGHDVEYHILGDGNDRPRVENFASHGPTPNRIRFLGQVPLPQLIDAYQQADAFVMPSTGEGFGIAFLEAMACGTPSIGLAEGGAPDALADGHSITASDLPAVLCRVLDTPRNSAATAAQVHARFGRDAFQTRANALLQRFSA